MMIGGECRTWHWGHEDQLDKAIIHDDNDDYEWLSLMIFMIMMIMMLILVMVMLGLGTGTRLRTGWNLKSEIWSQSRFHPGGHPDQPDDHSLVVNCDWYFCLGPHKIIKLLNRSEVSPDFIPVDVPINLMIVVAWSIAGSRRKPIPVIQIGLQRWF